MSKLEMVKALDNSQPQLQIVHAVTSLETQIHTLKMMLESLPQAVEKQTTQALEPLTSLRAEVTQVLTAYDTVTAAQRQALDELTLEMTTKAAQAFEQKVAKLDQTISTLSQHLPALTSSIDNMTKTANLIESTPQKLAESQAQMITAADELTQTAQRMRPQGWKTALGLILVGMLSAAAVLIGQGVFEKLVPPSAVQQKANLLMRIETKATPQEIELLNQIVNRPAK